MEETVGGAGRVGVCRGLAGVTENIEAAIEYYKARQPLRGTF